MHPTAAGYLAPNTPPTAIIGFRGDVYGKELLRPETRKVFEEAKSGPLADDSVNRWNVERRNYNEAVQ